MGKLVVKVLVGLALSAMVALAADNSLGTWKLNVAKSSTSPGAFPLKSLTTVRELTSAGVKMVSTGARVDGTPVTAAAVAKYDGKQVPVTGPGNPYDFISTTQVDANTFTIETRKNSGQYHSTGKIVISNNGKTMTTTTSGTDDNGRPFTSTLVYDKQ